MAVYAGVHISSTTLTVLNRFTGNLNVALVSAINKLVNAEVYAGNWSLYKQVLFYGMDTEANSLKDWKGFADATNVNSTPHTPWSGVAHSGFAGFAPDGSTKYINTGLAPISLTIDDSSFQSYMYENQDTSNALINFGAYDSAGSISWLHMTQIFGSRINGRHNENANSLVTYTGNAFFSNQTLWGIARQGITRYIVKDGVKVGSSTRVTSATNPYTIYLGGFNNTGTFVAQLPHKASYQIAHTDAGFDYAAAYTNWNKFLTNLGII